MKCTHSNIKSDIRAWQYFNQDLYYPETPKQTDRRVWLCENCGYSYAEGTVEFKTEPYK